ncbi:unnamed protein product, partial [Mesorhabditis belari]|uniref:Thioredoxin domain-containing protein n=1 Tax=Mesorhabditis belari TaxID=2138241 RepID=A0AAF3J6M8_9BILA
MRNLLLLTITFLLITSTFAKKEKKEKEEKKVKEEEKKEEKKEEAKEEKKEKDLSNGFAGDIDWVQWENAVEVAKEQNKPIFFLIHKTWCGACSSLKREFKSSQNTKDLVELSKKFVMVNVEDDGEPEDDKYAPDGGYIPRILFLDSNGSPLSTNNEKRYKNNKYFYPLVPQIIDAMARAQKEWTEVSGKNTESSSVKKDEKKKEEKKEKKEKEEKKEKKEKEEKKSKDEKKDKKKDDKEKKEKKEDKKEEKKGKDSKKKSKKDEL